MGWMDVYGRKPTAKAGEYFRATVWSWRPIHALIVELCSDLLDPTTLFRLGLNDGSGPKDQSTCTEMANRFERWMEHHVEGYVMDGMIKVTLDGRFVRTEELEKNPDPEAKSPYKVSDEHLKQWVEFLRHCGGFTVW